MRDQEAKISERLPQMHYKILGLNNSSGHDKCKYSVKSVHTSYMVLHRLMSNLQSFINYSLQFLLPKLQKNK